MQVIIAASFGLLIGVSAGSVVAWGTYFITKDRLSRIENQDCPDTWIWPTFILILYWCWALAVVLVG